MRLKSLCVLLILSVFVLTGCKIDEHDRKVKELEKVKPETIGRVVFYYEDEDFVKHDYCVDFDKNTIDKDGQIYSADEEKMDELAIYIAQYNPVLFAGQYWPETEEYPDLRILFDYRVHIHCNPEDLNEFDCYRIDGASDYGYPEDWDVLITKIDDAANIK